MCVSVCVSRIPEFKSFEELELPKHSKVKRQMSTPNVTDLEQQPEISEEEWLHKPTQEIIQKFHVSPRSLEKRRAALVKDISS